MKNVPRANGAATNPVRDVLSASIVNVIEQRQVELMMATLIPVVTDVDGLDVASKSVKFNRGYFKGTAQVTNQRPNTVPTVVLDSKMEEVDLAWISHGIRVTREDRDLYATGKTKFETKSLAAMRIMAEGEDNLLKKGFTQLGLEGLETIQGINVSTCSAKWNTLSGAQILEEIRLGWSAHTADGKFKSDELWLDKDLHDLLQKPYSAERYESVLEVLNGRNWFKKIISVPQFKSAMIVEKSQTNFGYIIETPMAMTEEYTEGTDDIYMLEEHLSELMVFQPESMTKLEGAL